MYSSTGRLYFHYIFHDRPDWQNMNCVGLLKWNSTPKTMRHRSRAVFGHMRECFHRITDVDSASSHFGQFWRSLWRQNPVLGGQCDARMTTFPSHGPRRHKLHFILCSLIIRLRTKWLTLLWQYTTGSILCLVVSPPPLGISAPPHFPVQKWAFQCMTHLV